MRRDATALGLGALALYLATLSRWYSADSLLFAIDIELGGQALQLDPYHLLLNPLCALAIAAAKAAGLAGIDGVAMMNALFGALCVALLFVLARRLRCPRRQAMIAAIGFAVSGGLWLLSTEGEGVTPGLAAQLALLCFLLPAPAGAPRGRAGALLLGAAIGFASLLYLTNALLLALAGLVLSERRGERPWRSSATWVAIGFAAVLAPPMIAMVRQSAVPLSGNVLRGYLGGGSYGVASWENLPRGVYGFLRSLLLFPDLGINDQTSVWLESASAAKRVAWATIYAVAALIAATPILAWARAGATIATGRRRRLALCIVLYGLFAFWWLPSDISFWVPLTAFWWTAVALLLARGGLNRNLVVAVVALLLVINGGGLIRQHHDARLNLPLQRALAIGAQLRSEDRLIASPGLALFVRYFARGASRGVRGDAEFRSALAAARLDTAETGGRVLVADLELTPARLDGITAVPVFETNSTAVVELR